MSQAAQVSPDVDQPAMNHSTIEEELVELIEQCRTPLLQYGAGVTGSADMALDALQEASLRYLVARQNGVVFDNPRAWLFRVVRHYGLDMLRKQSRISDIGDDRMGSITDTSDDPEAAYRRVQMADLIHRGLSPRERVCINHRLDGLSYEEISRAMVISSGTVGVLINRAVKKVRA